MQLQDLLKSPSPTARMLLAQIQAEERQIKDAKDQELADKKYQESLARVKLIEGLNAEITAALAKYETARLEAQSALRDAFSAARKLPQNTYNGQLDHLRKAHLPQAVPPPHSDLYPVFTSTETMIQTLAAPSKVNLTGSLPMPNNV